MQRWLLHLPVVLVAAGLAGCGDDGPATYPVSGTVTYDGKPLAKGQIAFRPDIAKGGSGSMQSTDIINGTFETEATQGPKRVEIYGQWKIPGEFVTSPETGKKFPAVASLPGKYNEFSKLTTVIEPADNTNVNFTLE